MTVSQRKKLMNVATILVVLVGVAVVVAGVLAPIRVEADAPDDGLALSNGMNGSSDALADAGPSLAALRAVTSIDLRRPLFDAPQAEEATQPQQTPKAQPPVQLIGTAHEANQPMAVFQRADGRTEAFGVGERFDEPGGTVTVKAIHPRRVTIEAGGRTYHLEMPAEPGVGN